MQLAWCFVISLEVSCVVKMIKNQLSKGGSHFVLHTCIRLDLCCHVLIWTLKRCIAGIHVNFPKLLVLLLLSAFLFFMQVYSSDEERAYILVWKIFHQKNTKIDLFVA